MTAPIGGGRGEGETAIVFVERKTLLRMRAPVVRMRGSEAKGLRRLSLMPLAAGLLAIMTGVSAASLCGVDVLNFDSEGVGLTRDTGEGTCPAESISPAPNLCASMRPADSCK